MGLLQKAIETYDSMSHLAGVIETEGKEPLAPIGHIIAKAAIEITIDADGQFVGGRAVGKEEGKIPIPVSEESAGRASGARAHYLCDNLTYVSSLYPDRHSLYLEALSDWISSPYSDAKIEAVYNYIKSDTTLADLNKCGLVKYDDKGGIKNEKDMICWSVIGLGERSGPVWTDKIVLNNYTKYYLDRKTDTGETVTCMLSGEMMPAAAQHIKGIIALNGNAKLISANDSTNFTYRGRFDNDSQALSVGYISSQKAHNALKWLAATQGTSFGSRTFICWNPQGHNVPNFFLPFMDNSELSPPEMPEYRSILRRKLMGFSVELPDESGVVITAFDAATTGRLSLAYYNELTASDYLERLVCWDETCCWTDGKFGIHSPLLINIIRYAFGTQRGQEETAKMEIDEKLLGPQIQRLVSCRIDKALFPLDIMRALSTKAGNLQIYNKSNRRKLLFTACAVIRKYRYDNYKEECPMSLEPNKHDISYQYGRLLAVLEKAERDTYDSNDGGRETNAIRMQQVFVRRPAYAFKLIIEQLKAAYYPKLTAGSRIFYDRLIGEITEQLSQFDDAELNKPLGESYLLGYYLQKNSLYSKNSGNQDEATTDETEEY